MLSRRPGGGWPGGQGSKAPGCPSFGAGEDPVPTLQDHLIPSYLGFPALISPTFFTRSPVLC